MIFAAEDFWRWQPHPEVWVLVVGLAAMYVYALRSLGPRAVGPTGTVATRSNKVWFVIGLLILWVAADWPMHDIAEEYLYSIHMLQHMLLTLFLPPVMLLATPEWLARAVVGSGPAGRWFLKLARPIPAAIVFNVVQLGTHWQGIVNASVENAPLHYGLHFLVVTTALAMWMPVVSPLPEYRISVPAQCVHLFLISIIPTIPAAWMALAEHALYSAYDKPARLWGVSVISDQQAAGLIMKLGDSVFLWTVIVVLYIRWVARSDRGTTARRVVLDADGNIVSVEGAAPLLYDDVAEAFASSVPPASDR